MFLFFFYKQKTAYEMRISDWSSYVCSSDLFAFPVSENHDFGRAAIIPARFRAGGARSFAREASSSDRADRDRRRSWRRRHDWARPRTSRARLRAARRHDSRNDRRRSEEHTSEPQSPTRISYAVFCTLQNKYKT